MVKYPLDEADLKLIPLALEVLERNFDDGVYNHTVGCALLCKNGTVYRRKLRRHPWLLCRVYHYGYCHFCR